MKRLAAFALSGFLASHTAEALATPFLVSDPWPMTENQPTACVYQEGTASPVSTPVAVNTDGSVYCHIDLGAVVPGVHAYQVWAANAWGVSPTVPFSFTAGAIPSAPAGMRVQ
jgi:hypothetical protein